MKVFQLIITAVILNLAVTNAWAQMTLSPHPCEVTNSGDSGADTLRNQVERFNQNGTQCHDITFTQDLTISLSSPLIIGDPTLHFAFEFFAEDNNASVPNQRRGIVVTGLDGNDLRNVTLDASEITREDGCAIVIAGGLSSFQQLRRLTIRAKRPEQRICDESGNNLMDDVIPSRSSTYRSGCTAGARADNCDFANITFEDSDNDDDNLTNEEETNVVGTNPNDPDTDGDFVMDSGDNCPLDANVGQVNTDGDSEGDACDNDDDNDGVEDALDLCPGTTVSPFPLMNPLLGSRIDSNGCRQSIINLNEALVNGINGPITVRPTVVVPAINFDSDNDGILNWSDNCQYISNASQADVDNDGVGDACDEDSDNDGVPDVVDLCMNDAGTLLNFGCPSDRCISQIDGSVQFVTGVDLDSDGVDAACDANDAPTSSDSDGDGLVDGADNCPLDANPLQENNDNDSLGDVCDADDDNDGRSDSFDNCPTVPNPDIADQDGDGVGNACDDDIDGDGFLNGDDNCPLGNNPNQNDANANGVGDACDTSTNPLIPTCDMQGSTHPGLPPFWIPSFELTWSTTNATSVSLTDDTGRVLSTNDRGSVHGLSRDVTYTLLAEAPGGSCRQLIVFGDLSDIPVIPVCNLEASLFTSSSGYDLVWSVINRVDEVSLSDGQSVLSSDSSGTLNVNPLVETTYTISGRTDRTRCSTSVILAGIGDDDNDGIDDTTDQCPGTTTGTPVNAEGCSDADGDGVSDEDDLCLLTLPGTTVDANGCPVGVGMDDDSDGIVNSNDQCPGTPLGMPVTVQGCPDEDQDGVQDADDLCLGTAPGTPTDTDGCAVPVTVDDADGDGIRDAFDNCPAFPSLDTTDTDGDGQGNPCDTDDDNDGVDDTTDNCALTANAGQEDADADNVGDACDTPSDMDGDGVLDSVDNCPGVMTLDTTDTDNDGQGNPCDADDDGDGIDDTADNCALVANPGQEDGNGNNIGDACDTPIDSDGDGILDNSDNCPMTSSVDLVDTDGDGQGNPCDTDDDGDGVDDTTDNCALVSNAGQDDNDADGVGDACDNPSDTDGDGIIDSSDNCPATVSLDTTDTDSDGQGNACDTDDDNDTIDDTTDNCSLMANTGQEDTDGDGIGDACDTPMVVVDGDGDGIADTVDNCPSINTTDLTDTDGDGQGNPCDADDDNDTIDDATDNCPLVVNAAQEDADGDRIGDACDTPVVVIPTAPTCVLNSQAMAGGSFDLTWATTDATTISLVLAGTTLSDEPNRSTPFTVTPVAVETYVLTATGPGGTCSQAITLAPPNVSFVDTDNDGIADTMDNCPGVASTDVSDGDGDGLGDPCDTDDDGDGVDDVADNCPFIPNSSQLDGDRDGVGDACDTSTSITVDGLPDTDNDGVPDDLETDLYDTNPNNPDSDGDGLTDGEEVNSPYFPVCGPLDPDCDDDGVCDGPGTVAGVCEPYQGTGDNCRLVSNGPRTPGILVADVQRDSNSDGVGDVCQDDLDGDGVPDNSDNCTFVPNVHQQDLDNNGIGDHCDPNFGFSQGGGSSGCGCRIDGQSAGKASDMLPFLMMMIPLTVFRTVRRKKC